jgi:hypothetical protein
MNMTVIVHVSVASFFFVYLKADVLFVEYECLEVIYRCCSMIECDEYEYILDIVCSIVCYEVHSVSLVEFKI